MAKYKVKHTNIMHNKQLYKEDSIIELSKNEADRLADFLDLVSEEKLTPTNKSTKNNSSKSKEKTDSNDNKTDDKGAVDG